METFLNYGLAWISIGLALYLAITYITRKMIRYQPKRRSFWISLNRSLRKHHKEVGVALVTTGLLHGLNSSMNVIDLNLGTFTWILSILLGLTYMFRDRLSKIKSWLAIHRFLTLAFILALALHINDVGGIRILEILSSGTSGSEVYTLDPATLDGQLIYGEFTDGIYSGSAMGYGNNLTVEVVLQDNTITSISIVSHNERNSRYYQKAFNSIPEAIIAAQSLDVDSVSGATFTSVGIVNAVNDALSDALVSGDLPSRLSLPTKRGH